LVGGKARLARHSHPAGFYTDNNLAGGKDCGKKHLSEADNPDLTSPLKGEE
jgi:hypothetical protein